MYVFVDHDLTTVTNTFTYFGYYFYKIMKKQFFLPDRLGAATCCFALEHIAYVVEFYLFRIDDYRNDKLLANGGVAAVGPRELDLDGK